MKAVILAGGSGSRLYPLTAVTNKHLLPLYNKPVIYYAIERLVAAGIDKIMIVSSPHHIEHFVALLGSGENFRTTFDHKRNIQIVYGIQDKPKGIAQGLSIAQDFIGNENCILWLGDGIVEDDLSGLIKGFTSGARIFLKEVNDPARFGVATVDKNFKVTEVIEKPKNPKSNLAVVGVYVYDNTVFKKMENQPLSERGEYEITDINNKYIKEGTLEAVTLKKPWFDIGTFESLFAGSEYMRNKELKILKNSRKKK